MADEQPTLTAVPDVDEAQGIRLDKTGRSVLQLGATTVTLRRPTFGEYRAAVEASDAAMEPAPTGKVAKGGATLNDPVVHAYLAFAPARYAWWRTIVATLGDVPLPDDDQLPMWLASADSINDVMGHWLSVPPAAPGG